MTAPLSPVRCFIIDDELPARQLIEKFVSRVPFLELIGTCDNAVDALFQVQQLQPSLIFLDVEMPEMTGFEFLRLLPTPKPEVIMVTAFPHYAVEGFEHQVTDYLLKPVSFERFMRAINKATGNRSFSPEAPTPAPPAAAPSPEPAPEHTDFILIKEDKKLIKVVPEEIVFIEGMKDYLKIHLPGRVLVTHMTMLKIEAMLPAALFLRVNRSYIVRKRAIQEIDGNVITTTDGKKVPIGVTFRESVMETLRKNRS